MNEIKTFRSGKEGIICEFGNRCRHKRQHRNSLIILRPFKIEQQCIHIHRVYYSSQIGHSFESILAEYSAIQTSNASNLMILANGHWNDLLFFSLSLYRYVSFLFVNSRFSFFFVILTISAKVIDTVNFSLCVFLAFHHSPLAENSTGQWTCPNWLANNHTFVVVQHSTKNRPELKHNDVFVELFFGNIRRRLIRKSYR